MLINVAIVEDNKETLDGLSMLLSKAGTMKVVGNYRTGESAIEELPVIKPHVALIDLGLPGISGTEVIKKLKGQMSLLQMLVLTAHDDKEHLFEALKAGASGYLLKDSPPAEIIESIEEIHNGGSPMSPKVARYVIEYFNEMELKRRRIEAVLTQREKEILNGISDGLTNKRLADRLYISTHTVRTHIKNIYEKLHVHSKVEAVMKAKREGML